MTMFYFVLCVFLLVLWGFLLLKYFTGFSLVCVEVVAYYISFLRNLGPNVYLMRSLMENLTVSKLLSSRRHFVWLLLANLTEYVTRK